jgi:hypothetical protein
MYLVMITAQLKISGTFPVYLFQFNDLAALCKAAAVTAITAVFLCQCAFGKHFTDCQSF